MVVVGEWVGVLVVVLVVVGVGVCDAVLEFVGV